MKYQAPLLYIKLGLVGFMLPEIFTFFFERKYPYPTKWALLGASILSVRPPKFFEL
jgi:hypothetical protein